MKALSVTWSKGNVNTCNGYVGERNMFTIRRSAGKYTLTAPGNKSATSTSVFKLHAIAQRIADGTQS